MSDSVAPGESLGPYPVLGRLGAGGMGEVLLARDPRLDRKIAIKVLPRAAAADPERLRRFEREARALAALNHPNIVTIFSVEEADDLHFYTMELVEGQTLAALIPPAGMPLDRLLAVAIPLVAALEAAHGRGITHRDLKPGNVMVTPEGTVKVLDFGLAKLVDAPPAVGSETTRSEPATHLGQVLGTYPYMSPEQVEGREVDQRSDIFSLGVVLYEMATGRRPFRGESVAALVAAILREEPAPPAALNPRLPAALDRLIVRCLEKAASARCRSAAEVRLALEHVRSAAATGGLAADSRPSIVVLPFANMSADPDQEYFCDGLAEEIINALARVEGVRVVARTSAFAFKGRNEDVREIGRRLGVGAVLEGSVRRAGDRLRISAQLIDVANGFHYWSERFDRTLADVFAIQDEISLAIVEKLKVHLRSEDERRLTHRATENRAAHDAYLKGRFFFYRRQPGDLERAIEQYRLAVALDPMFAPPLLSLAQASSALAVWGLLRPREAFGQARAAVAHALELDDELAGAHLEMGFLLFIHDFDRDAAQAHFTRALSLDFDSPIAHAWYSHYLGVAGRLEEACNEARLACELDPFNAMVLAAAGGGLLSGGRADEAVATLRRALELSPELAPAHLWLGVCQAHRGDFEAAVASYRRSLQGGLAGIALAFSVAALATAGRLEEARSERDRLEAMAGERYVPAIFRGWAAFALGDTAGAAAHVERAAADGEPCVMLTTAVAPPGLRALMESAMARQRGFTTTSRQA
jgi:eukaryotic-like serine/threonine-protein kinase